MPARDDVTSDVCVLVRRLDPDLPLPSYARAGDAGADLVAREDALLRAGGGRALVGTPASSSPAAAWRCATASRWPTRPG